MASPWPTKSSRFQVVRPRARELRHRRGNVEEHLELVVLLVKELAAVQNTARDPGDQRVVESWCASVGKMIGCMMDINKGGSNSQNKGYGKVQ